jgi:carbon monoxide dehydrogenase subunit G
MELEHTFTVPVPEERAWDVLLDVERVAPCMPGASLDSVDGDEIKGRIKVKVGPISMTYAGTARFTERDPDAHVITLEATGKETRGAGTASATVRSMLQGQGDQTHVIVHTSLNVTGRPAQFGRGVMAEVGGKLIGIFARNLADMLTADSAGDSQLELGESPAEASSAGVPQPATAQPATAPAGSADAPGGTADDLTLPVEELHLALRSHNSLRRDGIHTVGELAARTEQQLLAIDHIGPASVEEIRQKLAERGLSLSTAAGSAATEGATAAGSTDGAGALDSSTAPGSAAPGAAAANGAASSRAAANGDSGPAAQRRGPRPDPADSRPPGEDAIDLLSVAGLPVLKRAIPVLAGLLVAIAIVLRFRFRRRRANR